MPVQEWSVLTASDGVTRFDDAQSNAAAVPPWARQVLSTRSDAEGEPMKASAAEERAPVQQLTDDSRAGFAAYRAPGMIVAGLAGPVPRAGVEEAVRYLKTHQQASELAVLAVRGPAPDVGAGVYVVQGNGA